MSASGAGAPAKKKTSTLGQLAGIGGAGLGVLLSQVFGSALVFPVVFGLVAALILTKAGPARARPFVWAVSALVGHLGWMIAGAIFSGELATVAVDAVFMIAAGAWLVTRPGKAPAIALALFEVLSIAVNAWQLTTPEGAVAFGPLVLHLLLRVAVLAGLAAGWVAFRKQAVIVSRAALAQTFE